MYRFPRYCIASLAVLSAFCTIVPRCPAATPAQVDAAIDKSQKYLLSQQKAGGRWEIDAARVGDTNAWKTMQGGTWGGYTAIATYALLASGISSNDPHIVQAVAFLKKADIVGNYALGLRLQVWLLMWQNSAQADKAQYVALANADAGRLLKGCQKSGPGQNLWTYLPTSVLPAEASRIDHSVSQYGILGLWAAAQMGAEIPGKTWEDFDNRWKSDQMEDGGWSYDGSPASHTVRPVTASMTAAGIASLFIIQQNTLGSRAVACNGNILNNNIDNGLDWMTRHFSEATDLYAFYGIERIGVASGYKYFGKIDWYASIADKLVKTQNAEGYWDGSPPPVPAGGLSLFPGQSPVPSAAYGLLFFSRGGAPVFMNKLDYSITVGHKHRPGNWNERPRDIYNLTQWSGEQSEADMNFQVVSLEVSVKDLHDAPILYLAGNQALNLDAADIDKLREFVVEGGMILGNCDCAKKEFKDSFIQLGQAMFPAYGFRGLPPGHIIFQEGHAKFRGTPQVVGLSNGVREMMLLLPDDPSRAWQTKATFGKNVDDFRLGFNIFLYAVDTTGLRKKGVYYLVDPNPAIKPTKSIKIARLMVGGNPDPEPGGWPRLAAILHNKFDLEAQVTAVKPGDPLAGYKIVDLTGTTAFKLDGAQRAELLKFTQAGGTLIVDAAGGSGDFATSADAELGEIFGKDIAAAALARPLPPESAVYHLPNADITAVAYRPFAKKLLVGKVNVPAIRGIEVNKRIVAFYSREDLSAGLVGEPVDGIFGYSPDSATNLMRNLVLFCANPGQPALPPPAAKPK